MARNIQVRYSFTGGETDHEFKTAGKISSRSYNFLPDEKGFLRTFRGRKKILFPAPEEIHDTHVTNGITFIDIFGRERNVIVAGRNVLSIDGETLTSIFTYPASPAIVSDNDHVHVTMFEHQKHLILLHPHHPPLKWNGDEPVNWVGVREVPNSPEVHTYSVDQTTQLWGGYNAPDGNIDGSGHLIWGAITDVTSTPPYYPAVFLQSDLAPEADRTVADPESMYHWRVAFQNSNGQIGRWSSPATWKVVGTKGTNAEEKALTRLLPIIEWGRPEDKGPGQVGTDITHVWLCRTGNTIADPDAGAYFLQGIYPYTQNRTTDNKAGLSLAVDEDNFSPVNGGLGCSFKDTVLVSGSPEDPYGVFYSKPGYWESFPVLNYYKAADVVTAVLPLSDRVVVVTRTTIEVLTFQPSTGTFALMRKDDRRGSYLGRSLVVYKDNVFGIFSDGYGVFDGFQYKATASENEDMFDYIDRHNADRVRAVVDPESGYWCSVGYKATADNSPGGAGSLGIVMYFDFSRNSWYRVTDTYVSAMWYKNGQIMVGGKGNIYIWDAGGVDAPVARLELGNTSFSENDSRAAIIHKRINSVYLYVGSTTKWPATIEFFCDENLVAEKDSVSFELRGSRITTFQDTVMDPAWDDVDVLWDRDEAEWVSPRRFWGKVVDFSEVIDFYSLRTSITTEKGTYVEIAGIGYDVEVDQTQVGVP